MIGKLVLSLIMMNVYSDGTSSFLYGLTFLLTFLFTFITKIDECSSKIYVIGSREKL